MSPAVGGALRWLYPVTGGSIVKGTKFSNLYDYFKSLRRIDHSSRGVLPTVTRRVRSRTLEQEEAIARYRAVKIQPQCVITPGKQTNKRLF